MAYGFELAWNPTFIIHVHVARCPSRPSVNGANVDVDIDGTDPACRLQTQVPDEAPLLAITHRSY